MGMTWAAQQRADEMARRVRVLREHEEAAGRWFEGRNGGSADLVEYPEPRIARGDR